jgi:hypothetical protein
MVDITSLSVLHMDGVRAEAASESTDIILAMKRATDGTCKPVGVARDMLSCSTVRAAL